MQLAGQAPSVSRRALIEIAIGAALIVSGVLTAALLTEDSAYVIGDGPIFTGIVVILHGMSGLAGYKSFVAWRYLLNHDQRVTLRTKLLVAVGIAAYAATYGTSMIPMWGIPLSLQGGLDLHNP